MMIIIMNKRLPAPERNIINDKTDDNNSNRNDNNDDNNSNNSNNNNDNANNDKYRMKESNIMISTIIMAIM